MNNELLFAYCLFALLLVKPNVEECDASKASLMFQSRAQKKKIKQTDRGKALRRVQRNNLKDR